MYFDVDATKWELFVHWTNWGCLVTGSPITNRRPETKGCKRPSHAGGVEGLIFSRPMSTCRVSQCQLDAMPSKSSQWE